MSPIAILIFTVIIAAMIAAILNFRFLLYPLIPSLNPAAHVQRIKLKGSTLVISDLHLKSTEPFKYAGDLRNFVETKQISNLIVNGDLFNSPEDARDALGNPPEAAALSRELGLDRLPLNLFWVLGSPVHDPARLESQNNNSLLAVLGRCVLIDLDRVQVMAYHGHDLSVKGAFGHAWDRFISKLSLERAWKKMAKVDERLWVVFGHTHIPGVDSRYRVANSGGWQRAPFVRPTKTGLLISDEHDTPQLVNIA